MAQRSTRRPRPEPAAGARCALASAFVLYAAALGIGLLIYQPSLRGPFLSDDATYLTHNPQAQTVSLAHVREILDPSGDLALRTANYAPLHVLAHMAEWHLFGDAFWAYHLTNVALHALGVVLLVGLLRESGVGPRWALLGGGLFLVHPANVEAVAWISQLKTQLAMVFMLLALRIRRTRPVAGTLAFALALLAKATAAVALPVAVLLEWARTQTAGGRAGRWGDLGAWGVIFAAVAAAQLWAFRHAHLGAVPLAEETAARLWTSLAIAARYLAMAATSYGVSAFHEPDAVRSPLDPWVVGALVALALLGARSLWAVLRRREEAAWWAWAAVSFLPVAQVVPFVYPIADRYLYLLMPGLIGGALLAGQDLLAPWARRPWAGTLARAGEVAAVCVGLAFAWQSHGRAAVWTSEARLLADIILHYPNGPSARYVRAREAAAWGDAAAVVEHLRAATARGHRGLDVLADPAFAGVRAHPEFQRFARELARRQIEEIGRAERLTQPNRIKLAEAHLVAGEAARAVEVLEEALAAGGGFEPTIRELLDAARGAARPPRPAAR